MFNEDRNIRTQILASSKNFVEELLGEKFGQPAALQVTDYNMEKLSYPQNSIFYISQAFLTLQNSKKMYYADHFIHSQVIAVANLSEDIDSYQCKENEVKMYRPKCDLSRSFFNAVQNCWAHRRQR